VVDGMLLFVFKKSWYGKLHLYRPARHGPVTVKCCKTQRQERTFITGGRVPQQYSAWFRDRYSIKAVHSTDLVTTSGAIQYGVPTIVDRLLCSADSWAQNPKSAAKNSNDNNNNINDNDTNDDDDNNGNDTPHINTNAPLLFNLPILYPILWLGQTINKMFS